MNENNCTNCTSRLIPAETWPGSNGGDICQECWEIETSASWWDCVESLPHCLQNEEEA